MQLLAWIGFGLFCLSSLVVGSKLLRLWWRTRELPELLGGVSLLSMGPLGFVPTMLSSHLGTAVGDVVWACAFASLNLGCVAIFIFTVRVFYPGNRALLGMVGIGHSSCILA
ncbi:MAG TPA: hypothetical protein EYQ60_05355 [Myxococcales bacterium]|nr:hypothetical protein [Myxococcales bacterium]HIL81062.1 hypothetical protein [Myxococcales bacterium]